MQVSSIINIRLLTTLLLSICNISTAQSYQHNLYTHPYQGNITGIEYKNGSFYLAQNPSNNIDSYIYILDINDISIKQRLSISDIYKINTNVIDVEFDNEYMYLLVATFEGTATADINNDRKIDQNDLTFFHSQWLKTGYKSETKRYESDIDLNLKVDLRDYFLILSNWDKIPYTDYSPDWKWSYHILTLQDNIVINDISINYNIDNFCAYEEYFFLVSYSDKKIIKINKQGNTINQIDINNLFDKYGPSDMDNFNNNLLIRDHHGSKIYEITTAGDIVREIDTSSYSDGGKGLSVCSDGTQIYINDDNTLYSID